MEKLRKYRQLVKKLLREDAQYPPANGEIDPLLLFDEEHDNYQLMYVGWQGVRRVHAVLIHAALRNGKIWIETDGTEEGFANVLVEAGVSKEDIVLAFHPPYKRKYTDFAVA